ncbi:MAG: NAD(P)-dependent oxidoreductase [Halalkalicoccus sp.]
MTVLLTGANGTVGTAITDHLDREFTTLDVAGGADYEENVAEYDAIRPAFEGRDAVIHLAGYPATDATWEQALTNNVVGTQNVLRAASDAGVERVVFASSNHVVGMYEEEHAPNLYKPDYPLVVDHTDPIRPDSHYGASKACGEAFGRQYAENEGVGFFTLRIGSVRDPEYDHPYGDAERGVEAGRWERDSEEYERQVARMKGTWLSRRDCAQLVECCLDADREFEILYGVSDNDRRWFDIERARESVGYEPRDNGEEWDEPS